MAKQGCAAHETSVEPRLPWNRDLRGDLLLCARTEMLPWACPSRSGPLERFWNGSSGRCPPLFPPNISNFLEIFQARSGPLKLITHVSVTPTRACAPGRAQNASREAL